jgi:hypothetical protein
MASLSMHAEHGFDVRYLPARGGARIGCLEVRWVSAIAP